MQKATATKQSETLKSTTPETARKPVLNPPTALFRPETADKGTSTVDLPKPTQLKPLFTHV